MLAYRATGNSAIGGSIADRPVGCRACFGVARGAVRSAARFGASDGQRLVFVGVRSSVIRFTVSRWAAPAAAILAATLLSAACVEARQDAAADPGPTVAVRTEAASREQKPETRAAMDPAIDPAAAAAATWLAQPRFAAADLERGERLGFACIVCHTLEPGGAHLAGPNLHGVFGRPAASAAGFAYSGALREADVVWTPDALDAWLAEPEGFIPGNHMVFAGLHSVSDRSNLLAWLLRETAGLQTAGRGTAGPETTQLE